MTVTITVNGTDITDKVRLDGWRIEMAANQGKVGTGRLIIDDTTGAANLAPLATEWSVVASGATPTTIGGGFIAERNLDKGPLRAGTQRQFGPVLEDWNTVLTDRVLKGPAANRPEETDYQRINWLIGQNVLDMLAGDGKGHIPNANTVTMDPTNYRGKTPLDVLDDCAESAGKNFYIYYKGGTGWQLYYDVVAATEAAFTSTLQISDDPSDIDGSTVFGPSAVDYEEDPERIYAVLNVKWANGWVYEKNDTTASTYRNLQLTVIKENIKKASRARAWAQRQLAKLNEPTKRLELTVSVPESALGELRAGQRIQVKIRSRGITGFTYFRIAETVISPREGRRGVSDVEYDVRLKMFDKIRPVNLDDTYGGGDSSGGSYTGPSVPPPGGGTGSGGGSSSGSETESYVLDDFSRTTVVTPAALGNSSFANSGTSHDITLPDGCDEAGLGLTVILGDTWSDAGSPHFSSEMTALGFTHIGGYNDPGNATLHIWYKVIDGSEGWTGTSDTITLATAGGATVHSYAELLTGAASSAVSSVVATVDPPSLTPGWDTSHSARFYTICAGDTNRTSGPSGYTEVMDASTSGNYFDAHAKTDTSEADDPSAYSAGGTAHTMTAAVLLEGPHLFDTGATGITVGSFSSGTEAIDLPNDMASGDTILAVVHNTGTTENLANALVGHGFTLVSAQTLGTNRLGVLKYTLDGTEGWDDSTTLSWAVTSSGSYRSAMWLYKGGADIEANYSATVNPPALDPSWADDVSTDYWVYGFSDTAAPTGTPTGYTLYGSGAAGIYFREATKVGDTGASEDPATFGGGGGNNGAFTIAVGDASASGWGALPAGSGAPWEGTNIWTTSTSGSASAYVTGGAGVFVINADASSATAEVTSEGSEPWGPWDEGAEFLFLWRVDVLGDTSDADPNYVQFSVGSDGFRGKLRIHLGDNLNWSYMDPDQQRGIVVGQSTSDWSDFVPKTLAVDTDYYIRWDLRGVNVRAKLWKASDNEPVTWDIDVAKVDDASGGDSFSISAYGNITGGTVTHQFKQIDAALAAPTGGVVSTVLPPGDGASVTWAIEPFVGGITVTVDGILTQLASFDRDAGTITFDRAPDLGAVIRVEYTPS